MTNEVETYLQITADIEQAYKSAVGANRAQRRTSRAYRTDKRIFWFGVVGPSILAVLLAPAGIIESMEWVFTISWGLIAISYLTLLFYPLVSLWLYRHEVKRLMAAPFTRQMEANVKTVMQIDAHYLPQLVALSTETLKLGVLELKNERSGLEKRTHLVTGALEKIGVFPGILALFAGLTAVHKTLTEAGIATSPWHWAFAVAAASVFYLMCGYAQMLLVRYDRIVALTELAMERKKEQPETVPTPTP
ncbi:hypothetical protein EGJ27_14215 [Pseudomonas sp. v388]|uniref:hypothetical protein n=1 Tax=Pseudomonas sp. v388 TaxID=2479849 RepID=UPI000F771253|nr:hypothetical protein [Pseudomonas sp. v388]RRV06904.1 hypothetical protein EGJ27_14215 [Pseudomonas sp. v388]